MKPSRNDSCPCGSGKKYKHCCERKAATIPTPSVPTLAELNQLIALFNLGHLAEVENQSRILTDRFPESAVAWKLLGASLHRLGQGQNALPALVRATALLPKDAETHYNLGVTQESLGHFNEAVASYRKSLALQPNSAATLNNLGFSLQSLGQLDNAVTHYRLAIKIKPDYIGAYHNLGNVLRDIGEIDESITSCRSALAINPDFTEARSNLLFSLNYTATHANESCLEEARQYGQIVRKKVAARFSAWQCEAHPKRLRVGVVSGDLRHHPVGYALKNLLEQLNPNRVELIAYPTIQTVDEFTTLIQPFFAAWKPLSSLSNAAAARLIHTDKINVLLDLSGHTGHNGLPIFAWKPAPIQVSWLGYFATTGVAEMDYLITSQAAVPEAHQQQFSEKIWYLPDTWLSFSPPDDSLIATPLPAIKNKYVTFGCFQRLDKIGDAVLGAWAKILTRLPNAHLYMACKQLSEPTVLARFKRHLQSHGIDLARVEIQCATKTRALFLARYADVDIMLDSFPYPGVTTTCEALWMNVPTVTLAGNTLLSRQGAGVLTAANLNEWIAHDEDDYVAKAIHFASDLPKLGELRSTLRERVRVSPLFDAPRFAKHFEDALWGMWKTKYPD
jgi:predicted O-linked N-acetylglucosamine transferase (SPINDLY family)